MSTISTWSTTAASNNSTPPDGWPEGQAPSTVNNCGREMMAAVRTQHEAPSWSDLGFTPTRVSDTVFTVTGDQTAQYTVGRRVKITDTSTIYGTISVSAYTSLTTVTVVLDSGAITTPTAVALGIIDDKILLDEDDMSSDAIAACTQQSIKAYVDAQDVATANTADDTTILDTAGEFSVKDNGVTLVKLEDGTEGDILYYGASGAPARLAKGAATNVLSMNSGATAPEWAEGALVTSGSFTPTVVSGYTTSGAANATGYYVKVGKLVWATVSLNPQPSVTPTAAQLIIGLGNIGSSNNSTSAAYTSDVYFNGEAVPSTNLHGVMDAGGSNVAFFSQGATDQVSIVGNVIFTDGTEKVIRFSIMFGTD